ncbi:glycosyltransferase [Nocardioides pocheonensis]|uniref:glycosyltransferase n=1 Tax=Nocardioides pocheonensis TaxID=661485 RepID=UPI0016223514|nr:glycosyltransferase family 2 protein [Nocardioides pocheonensis]
MSAEPIAQSLDEPATERCLVVVPTYDEAENIDRLLDAVLAAAPYADVLVVDDNSPDGTARLVTRRREFGERVWLLERPGKAGLGAAYRAGFAWALERGYDRIAQMDADLSHPPERVPALFAALDDADVSVGSRYVDGGGVANWAWRRRLLSWAGNLYVRLVLGTGVHDNTAGFKAFRREALEDIGVLESESNGYSFQIENTWRAAQAGLSVVEVPITFTDRTEGQSKMSGSIATEALTRVLVWRFSEVLMFLAVGGFGYIVDVVAFNAFRLVEPFKALDPAYARTAAVVLAILVNYIGNRAWTWRNVPSDDRRRELALFFLFSVIGFGFSLACLLISHDVLGYTSALADNISANVVGLALGAVFRFWTYKKYVFHAQAPVREVRRASVKVPSRPA